MEQVQSAVGLIALFVLAWAIGERREAARWQVAAAGLAVQLVLALLLLRMPAARHLFVWLNEGVLALQRATEAGSRFVFGYLAGGPQPFETTAPGGDFILAFRALPLVIVISAITAVLIHWRVLPAIVRGFAVVFGRLMGTGGAVSVSVAANIFVGMVEAPLFVRPYIARLTRSELFVVMTCGMATIAGTVLVVYATFLAPIVHNAAGHLIAASIMSVPAAIAIARLMIPETEESRDEAAPVLSEADGTVDALARGTWAGLDLFLRIIAILIVFVTLVHLVNIVLAAAPEIAGAPLTVERLLGWLMAPFAWLIGLPASEAVAGGQLLGIKIALNEFIAYRDFAAGGEALDPRSRLILTYALCGFANFGSVGIMVGGLATIAPERKGEIAGLGVRALIAGNLATLSTGAVVGIVA